MASLAPPHPPSVKVNVTDTSQVGEARRRAGRFCAEAGFDDTQTGQVAIVVTELANNILRHASDGELLLRPLAGPVRGVEVLALDRGPGIADAARALQDGHSTRGTAGTGLGAVQRLSTRFELFTGPGGTAVVAQFGPDPGADGIEHGAVCLPFPGEEEPGDAWSFFRNADGMRVVVADGLGHGPQAFEAACTVCDAVRTAGPGPARALEQAHLAARPTRGAAAAIAETQWQGAEVRFAGVGNIAGVLSAPTASQSLVSVNGTLGQGVVKPREFSYPRRAGALLILCSDGLATRWSLDAYPGLASRHPSLIAGVLYRDFWRRRDDVTIVVARLGHS